MKRILVVSDSHGAVDKLDLILASQPQARIVFHLGDGARDLELIKHKYPNKYFHQVAGNCDFYSHLPEEVVDEIEGKRFFACHGHTLRVKYGIISLAEAARSENASVALYGHTHNPVTEYIDGVWFVNPGSMRDGNYAVVDITDSGIMPILMKIR